MKWIPDILQPNRSRNKEEDEWDVESFNRVIEFAESIQSADIRNLNWLVGLLARKSQIEQIIYMIENGDDERYEEVTGERFFFDIHKEVCGDGVTFRDIMVETSEEVEFDLANDPIFPNPWNRTRLVNCMSSIGSPTDPWQPNSINHRVEAWEPFGLGWVRNGNHSIATGVIKQEGKLNATTVYDVSEVFDYVDCDGKHYKRSSDGVIISEVSNMRHAAIFEVGRRISASM